MAFEYALLSHTCGLTFNSSAIQVSRVPKLVEYVNADNVTRVCSYLIACAEYCSEPDERILWTETAFACYMKTKQYPDAIRLALRLNDGDRQEAVFKAAADDRYSRLFVFDFRGACP